MTLDLQFPNMEMILKSGTSDCAKDWFVVGDYKKVPNEVGGMATTSPEKVASKMKALLLSYKSKDNKTLEDILEFHVQLERIHPFSKWQWSCWKINYVQGMP